MAILLLFYKVYLPSLNPWVTRTATMVKLSFKLYCKNGYLTKKTILKEELLFLKCSHKSSA